MSNVNSHPHTTVEQLRKASTKVRVSHFRYDLDGNLLPRREVKKGFFAGKGGSTKVDLSMPDGTEVSGTAVCAKRESFSYKNGLRIALGRALAALKDKQIVNSNPNT